MTLPNFPKLNMELLRQLKGLFYSKDQSIMLPNYGFIGLSSIDTPSTLPPFPYRFIYVKADGCVYILDWAGNEYKILKFNENGYIDYDIYQLKNYDIYPGGDNSGLFERLNIWTSPTYHFLSATELSSNFTWDAVNFAGTPSTISDSFNSLLAIYNSAANDFFAYRTLVSTGTVQIDMRCTIGSLSATAYAYGGLRIDNPAAPTTNFFEVRLVPGSGADGMRLLVRYDTGGGLNTAYYADFLPSGFFTLRLIFIDASNVGAVYYTTNSPRPSFITNTGPTWTSATVRAGIITGLVGGSAGSLDRAAYFDYWDE